MTQSEEIKVRGTIIIIIIGWKGYYIFVGVYIYYGRWDKEDMNAKEVKGVRVSPGLSSSGLERVHRACTG